MYNNNDNDNWNVKVYGAVIMMTAIARIQSVHLMNADSVPDDQQGKPTSLGYIVDIHHHHLLLLLFNQKRWWYSFTVA